MAYKPEYELLVNSGLHQVLVNEQLLIPHEEVDISYAFSDMAYKILKPRSVEFISYPYEWCFSQLKDAALAILRIQRIALKFGMSLKDCSAYNMQFVKGSPMLIDTLSFETYRPGYPWCAYLQFCQYFLAPLSLMCYTDMRMNKLLLFFIDGIPLDLASTLLALPSRLSPAILMHIHLHAKSQERFKDTQIKTEGTRVNNRYMLWLINSLESAVAGLKKPRKKSSSWVNYYNEEAGYSSSALLCKKQLVGEFIDSIKPEVVWDLGANTGLFSRIASSRNIQVISVDSDIEAVEENYSRCKREGEKNILPLCVDLINPSSGIGWENKERVPFLERGHTGTAIVLALIHHLAISNNLPFDKIAHCLSSFCNTLIIEFVNKNDVNLKKLLLHREDIFSGYTKDNFELQFSKYFTILKSTEIGFSKRSLYLMQKK
ncbi:MAG: SAM-dependent methyltransferase [Candidatus Omnitrophota bacterium]